MSAKKGAPQPPLPLAGPEVIDEAIASLVELMRRAVVCSKEEHPFQDLVNFMDKYSRVCARLAALVRAQGARAEEQGFSEALNQALSELMDEMKAK